MDLVNIIREYFTNGVPESVVSVGVGVALASSVGCLAYAIFGKPVEGRQSIFREWREKKKYKQLEFDFKKESIKYK